MEEKILKRGYYFPEKLLEEWEKFHSPSKDFSPSASGAFLVWMCLSPSFRESARKQAHQGDISKALSNIRQALKEDLVETEADEILKEMGISTEGFLTLVKQVKAKASQKK